MINCNELFSFSDGPHFEEEPTDADVTPGGTVIFSCRVHDGDDIFWTKNGIKVAPSSRIQLLVSGSLVIANAQSKDIGEYRCHASSLVSRSARIRFYRGRAKPAIVHTPQHTEEEKGSTIRLNCVSSGFPRPTFAWYKDGGRLSTAHSRFKVTTPVPQGRVFLDYLFLISD